VELVQIETLVGELETAVDRLRSLYEQYFMGFEKTEPQVPRKDVDRKIHALRKEHFRNTALRFRFQMILQRYNTYQTHWQRILREIENGTYKRHVLRAERRFGDVATRPVSRPPPPPSARPGLPAAAVPGPPAALPQPGAALPSNVLAELAELDRDFDATPLAPPAARIPAPRPPQPAPPRASPPPPPRPAAAPPPAPAAQASPPRAPPPAQPPSPPGPPSPPKSDDLPEERVRELYARYVDSKRRQNESTAAITYQAVAKTLRDSSTKLQQKHGKKVDFEVTVKDGKTILKPVLK